MRVYYRTSHNTGVSFGFWTLLFLGPFILCWYLLVGAIYLIAIIVLAILKLVGMGRRA